MGRLAGYYRLHRSSIGGGISMSIREEIWSKLSKTTFTSKRFGGEIITEHIKKWLLGSSYNSHQEGIISSGRHNIFALSLLKRVSIVNV